MREHVITMDSLKQIDKPIILILYGGTVNLKAHSMNRGDKKNKELRE